MNKKKMYKITRPEISIFSLEGYQPMLYYYNQELTFPELVTELLSLDNNNTCYILVADPEIYSQYIKLKLSPRNIVNLQKFKLILIESWSEIAEFITSIEERCTVVLYGIIKWFVEMGHNEESHFLKAHEFCAWEVNKLFHKMFIKHTENNVSIIVSDGIGEEENNCPLIWNINLPNIRTRLIETNQESKISLRVIFIKWFKVVTQINDIECK